MRVTRFRLRVRDHERRVPRHGAHFVCRFAGVVAGAETQCAEIGGRAKIRVASIDIMKKLNFDHEFFYVHVIN